MKFFSTLLTVILAFSFSSLADEKKKIVFLLMEERTQKLMLMKVVTLFLQKRLKKVGSDLKHHSTRDGPLMLRFSRELTV